MGGGGGSRSRSASRARAESRGPTHAQLRRPGQALPYHLGYPGSSTLGPVSLLALPSAQHPIFVRGQTTLGAGAEPELGPCQYPGSPSHPMAHGTVGAEATQQHRAEVGAGNPGARSSRPAATTEGATLCSGHGVRVQPSRVACMRLPASGLRAPTLQSPAPQLSLVTPSLGQGCLEPGGREGGAPATRSRARSRAGWVHSGIHTFGSSGQSVG